ncbi:DUF429 domain-containing protein [Flexivirga sp. ID2601S]|uniref:DUF429 domain-containing protein n=1 Tax=Flexivirga aerilata TaxID=1656889 RepID=A0A849ACY6_9MICO|nr:DUF429 domain-containing protein [Flexivirga aerilata]NNG37767.1 DUF429 domain-containing protein [Flexivirga aerilata]
MYFVGLDLAWGSRNPSGVAVLDDDGALQLLTAVVSDDEIAASVAPYLQDRCVVGVDAPLVVTNPTGSRRAEKDLGRDFAPFQAGAHPTNTGKFPDGTRGARLCAALSLDMDPESTAPRRAVEVYPHPATIALFRLGRTLKYKNKPGRTLEQLRGELLTLVRLLESLSTARPQMRLVSSSAWRDLVAGIERATRKSQLRDAEDQVDAVVCAYVVLLRERVPEAVVTYGDFADGYIVTPRLPAGLAPSPRAPRVERRVDVVRRATEEYAALYPQLELAAAEAVALVTGILDDAGLNYLSVTGRAKSVASFAEKAGRRAGDTPLYADPLHDIGDLIGVRVITYVRSDVAAVAELLAAEAVVSDDRDLGQETASEGRFGYASRHLQVRAAAEDVPSYPELAGRQLQVQIRTVLQHAWAEFEHDIRYKGTVPGEHRSDFDRRFTLAAGLLELADQEFTTIRDTLRDAVPEAEEHDAADDRISPRELAAYLAGQYAEAGWSRPDHYAWIAGLVHELGIGSLADLAAALRAVDTDRIDRVMAYRTPPGAVRRLDDALLAAFGDRYVALPGNSHRVERLRTRAAKLDAG